MEKYGNFMDQDYPPIEVVEVMAEYDNEPAYEVDQGAIFRTVDNRFIGVVISGCS